MAEQQRCHICGEMRQPEMLSLETHKTTMPGTNRKVEERILYCNDKAECTSRAPRFSFIRTSAPAVTQRRRLAPGEEVR